jgi:uncharacterized protein (TIGR00730 family)
VGPSATVAAVRTIPEQVAVDRDAYPADPGRDGLYSADELYDAMPYDDSLDARTYRWALESHTPAAVLSRALHDEGVDAALGRWVGGRRMVGVMGGHGIARGSQEYDDTARLAALLGRDRTVVTGGGPGLMEAANRGAREAGAPSIGFNISLPAEQRPNPYSTPELTFRFHYFGMRKMHLAMRANALAIFPGGFGTLDELFEILTLQQTGKAPPTPTVLFGRDYWRRIVDFRALAEEGMIAPADLDLFEIVDEAEEGWAALVRRGLTAHAPQNPPPDP